LTGFTPVPSAGATGQAGFYRIILFFIFITFLMKVMKNNPPWSGKKLMGDVGSFVSFFWHGFHRLHCFCFIFAIEIQAP